MKSILKNVAGIAIAATLALGIAGCKINVVTHEHSFATEWTNDATHHWHAASCEHTDQVKDKAEHSFGEWNIKTQPSETAEGLRERECSVCGYKVTETIAKLEHSFGEWSSNNDATTWADGTKYRICSVCSYKETVTDEESKLPKPDFASCKIGDFILKNGTVLSKDNTPESDTVAAVIVREATKDKPALGVGIEHKTGLAWSITDAHGYKIYIRPLQGYLNKGYTDGSDSWKRLKDSTNDAERHPEYYPAWNYILNYATTNGLEGDLANGWYFPTVTELHTIYQNKATVDASLEKAGGTQFGTKWYRSCSQHENSNLGAWNLNFDDGVVQVCVKYDDTLYICSVRAFN